MMNWTANFQSLSRIRLLPKRSGSNLTRIATLIWAHCTFLRGSNLNSSFSYCHHSDAIFSKLPKLAVKSTANCQLRCTLLSVKRGKHDNANISSSGTGNPNMSHSKVSIRDRPRWKSKLESELLQNPPDLRSLFYIYGFATLRTFADFWPVREL
jgi:hypothetical protein